MGRKLGDVLAVEPDRARGRRKESADQVEEGGLAGAVRPDDGAHLAFGHIERDVAHRHQIAEAFCHVLNLENVDGAAHALLRCRKPSSPRGKNNTTSTNNSPTNDIQLTVMLDR